MEALILGVCCIRVWPLVEAAFLILQKLVAEMCHLLAFKVNLQA